MKKIIITPLIAVCIALTLTSCRGEDVLTEESRTEWEYLGVYVIIPNNQGMVYLYRDEMTDFLWLVYNNGYRGSAAYMLDEDGKPVTYAKWVEQGNGTADK